jgi:hypothetical protein
MPPPPPPPPAGAAVQDPHCPRDARVDRRAGGAAGHAADARAGGAGREGRRPGRPRAAAGKAHRCAPWGSVCCSRRGAARNAARVAGCGGGAAEAGAGRWLLGPAARRAGRHAPPASAASPGPAPALAPNPAQARPAAGPTRKGSALTRATTSPWTSQRPVRHVNACTHPHARTHAHTHTHTRTHARTHARAHNVLRPLRGSQPLLGLENCCCGGVGARAAARPCAARGP